MVVDFNCKVLFNEPHNAFNVVIENSGPDYLRVIIEGDDGYYKSKRIAANDSDTISMTEAKGDVKYTVTLKAERMFDEVPAYAKGTYKISSYYN